MASPNSTIANWLNFGARELGFGLKDGMDGEAFAHFSRFRSHVNYQYRKPYKTWGYVVLRTVYRPGSDEEFARAMSTLKNWVRFSVYNSFYPYPRVEHPSQEPREKAATNIEANDWLFDRFRFDIIEDEANLNITDSNWFREETGIPLELCRYFRNWLSQKGIDPDTPFHPRFVDCIVIDEASLSALLAQSEPPPGGYKLDAADNDEKRSILAPSQADAFVWLLDTYVLHNKPRWIEEDPDFSEQCNEFWPPGVKVDQGVIQVDIHKLRRTWFDRLRQEDQLNGTPCEEWPEGSGVYRCADS